MIPLVILIAACQPLAQPKRMPPLDALVDSVGLLTGLQAAATDGAEEIVIGVRASDQPRGHLVGATQPADGEVVLGLVLAALRPAGKDTPAAFRILVRPGKHAVVRLDRSVLCAPELQEGEGVKLPPIVKEGRVTSTTNPNDRPPEEMRPVTVKLRINTSGAVTEVNLVNGSGFPEFDRLTRETMGRRHYRPALLDGRPVEVWLTGDKTELVP